MHVRAYTYIATHLFIFHREVFGELFAYTSASYPFNVAGRQNVSLHFEMKDDYDGPDVETSTFGIY